MPFGREIKCCIMGDCAPSPNSTPPAAGSPGPAPSQQPPRPTPLTPPTPPTSGFTSSFFLLHKTANLLARRHRQMLMDSFVKNLPLIYCPLPLPPLLLEEVESVGVWGGERGFRGGNSGQSQNIDSPVRHRRESPP